MKKNQKKPNSTDDQILKAINSLGCGAVFVPTDFLDFGSRQAVDIVLHRLVRKGTIRRLARGIYDFPKVHPKLGKLLPSPEKIAETLVNRDCTRIQPTGAYAANQHQTGFLVITLILPHLQTIRRPSKLLIITIFETVVSLKHLFFRSSWTSYTQAKPGTFRLVPRSERLPELGRDYQLMRGMYLNEPLGFDDILSILSNLEHHINLIPRTLV